MGIIDFLFQKEAKKVLKPHIIEKDGVEYRYLKIKKSKSIKISIKDRFHVKITLPFSCPYKVAEDFAKSKEGWIKSELERLEFFQIDENFKTRTGNFIVSTGLVGAPVIKQTGGIVQFIYPIGADFYSKEIQEKARLALKKALQIEAKNYLPQRINFLAEKFGFKYNKLTLKAHKTRWGSCSFVNNINLNINLMNLEDEFIDYVLIHELCHTVEKNHKESFWRLVNSCMPEASKIKKELKTKRIVV